MILGILVVGFGYILDISRLQSTLKKNQKQIVVAREYISRRKSGVFQDKLTSKKLVFPQSPIIKPIAQAPGLEMINILHVLEKLMFETHITTYLFEPGVLEEDQWFNIYPIKLGFSGEYKTILMLFKRISQLPYLLVIKELEIQVSNSGVTGINNLSVNLLLVVYNKKYNVNENMVNIQMRKDLLFLTSEKDVFKRPEAAANLLMWGSKELQFLGLIKEAQKTFGIVSDPLGRIYRIKVGDKVGLNQSTVAVINEKGIATVSPVDNIYRER